MRYRAANLLKATAVIAAGIALGAAGLFIGQVDDAPGAGLLGILLMLGAVVLGVRIACRRA